MKLILEKRPERSARMALLSPLLAIALTVFFGGIIFALLGLNPLRALYVYFIDPLTSMWSIEELIVKASPLIMIGVGLAICFEARVWNIGAEGQLTMGALAGSMIPIYFTSWQSPLTLVAMLLLGIIGGALYGAIPALLKTRFGANEILTSLMLVYVAQLLGDWLVRGPWRDPNGFNFPKSVTFEGWQVLPTFGEGRVHIGAILAIIAALALAFMMAKTKKGFEIRIMGNAPRAGMFSGFSPKKTVWFTMLLSGALAGLAGIIEVAGPAGNLQPSISPGYGFTAIIVAFLGRLNPIGVIFAGLMLAISYLGGESAQIDLGVSARIAQVFQGMLLFFILACDTLILYRIKLLGNDGKVSADKVRQG
ncbi:MAG TPA: ABC transporter permease [Rhizobiales bacterium]|nr:ABC transporter permease [Hyphomicrobiales bacterium]